MRLLRLLRDLATLPLALVIVALAMGWDWVDRERRGRAIARGTWR